MKTLLLLLAFCMLKTQLIEGRVIAVQKRQEKVVSKNCILPDKTSRKPVIIVPGVLGSQIFAKLDKKNTSKNNQCPTTTDWYQLWFNLNTLAFGAMDCWVDNIKMKYSRSTRMVENTQGVKTKIPDFGNTIAFENLSPRVSMFGLNYFYDLVHHLTCKLGYTRKKDLLGAPYDWRVAPIQQTDYFTKLKILIEESHKSNNRKVVLLGHSMGNTYIYYFLSKQSQKWKDTYVDSFVSISSPYLGSIKSAKATISGDTEGHDFFLNRLLMREVCQTFSSFLYMMPHPGLWPSEAPIVYTQHRNYTVHDYKHLFEDVGCETCYEMWKDNSMTLGNLTAPSVAVHCIYSSRIPTYTALRYAGSTFPDGNPELIEGDGDGTITTSSSSACLKWKLDQKQPIYNVNLSGNTHVGILNNQTLYSYLEKVIML